MRLVCFRSDGRIGVDLLLQKKVEGQPLGRAKKGAFKQEVPVDHSSTCLMKTDICTRR